jgi:hypothetical protein
VVAVNLKYTCPCCGFKTLNEPFTYDICGICDWEDDPIQQENPALGLGPNDGSLYDEQRKILMLLPLDFKQHKGFQRDSEWRPLTKDECTLPEMLHKTGLDYFHLASSDGEPFCYYWKKMK